MLVAGTVCQLSVDGRSEGGVELHFRWGAHRMGHSQQPDKSDVQLVGMFQRKPFQHRWRSGCQVSYKHRDIIQL